MKESKERTPVFIKIAEYKEVIDIIGLIKEKIDL